jgi:hypothetical protein
VVDLDEVVVHAPALCKQLWCRSELCQVVDEEVR